MTNDKYDWHIQACKIQVLAAKLLTQYYGERCKGYPNDRPCYCATCRRWRVLGELLSFPDEKPAEGGDAP